MRNIKEYPITADEVKRTLQYELDRINGFGDPKQVIVGGVNGLIWRALLNVLDVQLDKDLTVMDLVLEDANPF